jgi:RNA polymerase sigma-70 factor (ECF subfamily)
VSAHEAPCEYTTLVREHLDFIWRLLRRFGLSPADADDAAQQVFLLAEGRLERIVPGKERSFLYGVAVRVAANARRASRNRREVPDGELPPPAAKDAPPDRLLELERARLLLDEILSRLPDDLRRVLVLAEVEEETLASIADLEAIPPGTAASRLRRARALFRELLAAEEHRNPFGGGPS